MLFNLIKFLIFCTLDSHLTAIASICLMWPQFLGAVMSRSRQNLKLSKFWKILNFLATTYLEHIHNGLKYRTKWNEFLFSASLHNINTHQSTCLAFQIKYWFPILLQIPFDNTRKGTPLNQAPLYQRISSFPVLFLHIGRQLCFVVRLHPLQFVQFGVDCLSTIRDHVPSNL